MNLTRMREALRHGAVEPFFAALYHGGSSAPPPPDYRAAAEETGQASKENLASQTWANRPQFNTPFGQQTWDTSSATDPSTGQPVTSWTSNLNLTPEMQSALNAQQRITSGRSGAAETLLGQATSSFQTPFNWAGMPQMGGTPQSRATGPEATQRGVQQYGLDTHAPQQTTFGSNEAGFGAERQRIENELFSRMAPEHARQTEAARTRLANQGMTMGSEAYNRELERIGGLQAGERFNALQTGGAEQQRLNQMLLAQNQQAFGQDTAAQQAQNAALQAQFGQGLAAGQFANQAGQQAFGQNLAANQQNFGQDLSAAQFQNQNRQQALAEEAYRRGLPLNELNALLTGQQVGAPQMPSFSQSGMASPTNYLGAAQSQGDYSMDVAKMDAAANNALLGTAGSVAGALGAAAIMTSDRRLKKNIVPLGRGWYAFNYLWDNVLRFGVMAQEVLAWKPEAVGIDALGFYTVDYARL